MNGRPIAVILLSVKDPSNNVKYPDISYTFHVKMMAVKPDFQHLEEIFSPKETIQSVNLRKICLKIGRKLSFSLELYGDETSCVQFCYVQSVVNGFVNSTGSMNRIHGWADKHD